MRRPRRRYAPPDTAAVARWPTGRTVPSRRPRRRCRSRPCDLLLVENGSEDVLQARLEAGAAREVAGLARSDVGMHAGPFAEEILVPQAELPGRVVLTGRIEPRRHGFQASCPQWRRGPDH